MSLTRRNILGASLACLASPAQAAPPPIAAIAAYEQASRGHVGMYARNIHTGATLSWRQDERFVMCSTFKASLAGCILWRVDHREDDLNATIRFGPADLLNSYAPVAQANLAKGVMSVGQMCQAAVEQSDNTCANLLLARIGGPPALTGFWRRTGDRFSRLDDPEPILNRTPPGSARDTTTPRAMADTIARLALGPTLSPASRNMFSNWLIGCQTGANRLRAGLPASWVIGDKTGHNDRDAAGDIAIAWPKPGHPIIICAYTRGGTPAVDQFDAVFKGIGRAVATKLSPN